MKGLVFKEFLKLVENTFGYETVDAIIEDAKVDTQGAYTSIGTYHHTELIKLVTQLGDKTQIPFSKLLKIFGKNLIPTFAIRFPDFFKAQNSFEFLKVLHNNIHVEVKKLYNDAELPIFTILQQDSKILILEYQSSRPFADLAEGLIEGLIIHYNEKIELKVDNPKKTNNHRIFTLIRINTDE